MMIIFDTKNNYDGQIKGMLYLSMMDVDYLMKKYGSEDLKKMIPVDYVEHFESELRDREKEDAFSIQYYAILSLGIENENDERLLTLLSQEVEMGNLLTKSQLSKLPEEKLENLIAELQEEKEEKSLEDIYRLRSFMMAKFILTSIGDYNKSVERAYQGIGLIPNQANIIETSKNWKAMGVSSDIEESNYFEKAVLMAKRFDGLKGE